MRGGRDAYSTLGVATDAAPSEVRRAYLRLVRTWHPDRYANDPRLQQRALEMLKIINDAYEQVCAGQGRPHSGSIPDPPGFTPAANIPEPGPAATSFAGVEGAPAPVDSGAISGPSALFTPIFFSSWQNWAFVLLAGAVVIIVEARYGSIFQGAGYLLEMLALPAMFAFACNLGRFAPGRAMWRAYVAVVCLFAMIVLYDSMSYNNKLDEAALYGEPSVSDETIVPKGYVPGIPSGSLEGLATKRSYSIGGPAAPVPPQVNAPDAPLAPMAPLAPAVPPAPPAR